MELWLDTCDTQVIANASKLGFIYGVTTNPTILAEARDDYEKVINNLLEVQDGPLAIQVTADNAQQMIKQAVALHAFSDRIIVKVPVTKEGLIAMKEMKEEGIPILATAVFQPNQALLAGLAGADYVAPYVSRMLDAGVDAYNAVQSMMTMFKHYEMKTKVLAAAIRTPDQITICAEMGVPAITLKSSIYSQFIADDPSTVACLKTFAEDWEARPQCVHTSFAL